VAQVGKRFLVASSGSCDGHAGSYARAPLAFPPSAPRDEALAKRGPPPPLGAARPGIRFLRAPWDPTGHPRFAFSQIVLRQGIETELRPASARFRRRDLPFAISQVSFVAPDDDTTRANQSRGWDAKPRAPCGKPSYRTSSLRSPGRHPRGNRDPVPAPCRLTPGEKLLFPPTSLRALRGSEPTPARRRYARFAANATRMSTRTSTGRTGQGRRRTGWCCVSRNGLGPRDVGVRPYQRPDADALRTVPEAEPRIGRAGARPEGEALERSPAAAGLSAERGGDATSDRRWGPVEPASLPLAISLGKEWIAMGSAMG
jgi:hypothetical protein